MDWHLICNEIVLHFELEVEMKEFPGRNDPCLCGSGKKFKKCCLSQGTQVPAPILSPNKNSIHNQRKREFLNIEFLAKASISELEPFEQQAGVLKRTRAKTKSIFLSSLEFELVKFIHKNSLIIAMNLPKAFWRGKEKTVSIEIDSQGALCFASDSSLEIQSFAILALQSLLTNQPEQCSSFALEVTNDANQKIKDVLRSFFSLDSNLVHLKGLVFCNPPPLQKTEKILNTREEGWTEISSAIPPSSVPLLFVDDSGNVVDYSSLLEKVNKPKFFGYYDLEKRWLPIRFLFSDGVHLGLEELFEDPHALLLPSGFFPLKPLSNSSEINPETPPYCMVTDHSRHWGDDPTDLAKQALLHHVVLSLVMQPSLNLQFFFGKMKVLTRSSIPYFKDTDLELVAISPLSQVHFLSKADFCLRHRFTSSTSSRVELVLNEKAGNSDGELVPLNPWLYLEPTKNAIYIHPGRSLADLLWNRIFYLARIENNVFPVVQAWELKSTAAALRANPELLSLSREFEISFEPPVTKSISILDSSATVHLNSKDENFWDFSLQFADPLKKKEITLSGIPKVYSSLAMLLSEGIGSVLLDIHEDLAVRKKGEQRQWELKVMRHRGLAFVFALEFLSYQRLQGQNQLSKDASFSFSKWMRRVFHLFLGEIVGGKEKMAGDFDQWFTNRSLFSAALCHSKNGTLPAEFQIEIEKFRSEKAGKSELISSKLNQKLCEVIAVSETLMEDPSTNILSQQTILALPLAQWGVEILWRQCQQILEEEGIACFYKVNTKKNKFSPVGENHYLRKLYFEGAFRSFLTYSFPYPIQYTIDGIQVNQLQPGALEKTLNIGQKEDGKLNWFALHPKVFFGGREISIEEFFDVDGRFRNYIVDHEGKFYLLDPKEFTPLRWLHFFWQKIQSTKKGTVKFGSTEKNYVQERAKVLEVLALHRLGLSIDGGDEWREVCKFYDELENPKKTVSMSAGFQGSLKEYQVKGVQWLTDLYRLKMGGILADDMGLGKTVQVLAFLENLRNEGKLGHVLIVVPTSLTYNWLAESEKFCPLLPMAELVVDQLREIAPEGVFVTTYGMLRNHIEALKEVEWNIVVFDEAQNLKNLFAKATAAARDLPAKVKFCLSGTPMENHYLDFFSLVDLVLPGALGEYEEFKSRFGKEVESPLKPEEISFLRQRVKPILLRRRKSEILVELPEKIESILQLEFSQSQEKIYKDTAVSWNEKVLSLIAEVGEKKSQMQMLTALLRLRQICTSPKLLPNSEYTEITPKIEKILEMVKSLIESGDSVLIFTTFLDSMQMIVSLMQAHGIPVLCFNGQTNRANRKLILEEFSSSSQPQVLVMTMKTGGIGLNLTKANYVFHVEPWWNPAVENQAVDRAHRVGQMKSVNVYRMVMRHSVEEKIQKLKSFKSAAFRALLEEETSLMLAETKGDGSISREDFSYLLSI